MLIVHGLLCVTLGNCYVLSVIQFETEIIASTSYGNNFNFLKIFIFSLMCYFNNYFLFKHIVGEVKIENVWLQNNNNEIGDER